MDEQNNNIIFLSIVADLIHGLHAVSYKTIVYYFEEQLQESRESWIQHNTYFGYAISIVSFAAVLQLLFMELWNSIKVKYEKPFNNVQKVRNSRKWLLQEFGISHGYLWSFSLITCFIIILTGEDCEHFV